MPRPTAPEVFGSLATIRRLRGTAEDQALGVLLWLAATDGGDDQLAAVAVLHLLGGSARVNARHFWHAAEGDAAGIVTGAMWEQIRAYNWHERTGRHAQAIHHETRNAVRSVLLRDPSRGQTRGVIPLNPQSWLFEAVMERPLAEELRVTDLGPQDGVLLTKAGREVVPHEYEARMLTVTKGALVGVAGSLRRHLHVQAQRLAVSIVDRDLPWTGASWR